MRHLFASLLLVPLVNLHASAAQADPAEIGPLVFDASSVTIDDFVGTLNVEVGDGPGITLGIRGPQDKVEDLSIRTENLTLIIRRGMGRRGTGQGSRLGEYPVINLQVPSGTALTIDDMDGAATVGDLNAPVRVYVASLDASFGDVTSADVDRFGSGDISFGRVAEGLSATLSGSGDITVVSAIAVDVTKRGSGDVVLGSVAGAVTAEMRGSGDIRIDSAESVHIRKRGSGDIELGEVRGAFHFEGAGIGDVDVVSVDGPVSIDAASSGKIHIHGGSADPLKVSLAEYSDFTLDGIAVDPDISVSGASIIKLQDYTGEFKAVGAGDIRVAGHRVYPLSRLDAAVGGN